MKTKQGRQAVNEEELVKGVCCSCQATHRVRLWIDPKLYEYWVNAETAVQMAHLVMGEHRVWDEGPWCEGAGTVPQAIVYCVSSLHHPAPRAVDGVDCPSCGSRMRGEGSGYRCDSCGMFSSLT